MKDGLPYSLLDWLASSLLVVWVPGNTLAFFYYNYQYYDEHGYLRWLVFGWLIATLEGVLWPLWLLLELLG